VLPSDVYDITLADALSFLQQQEKRRKDEYIFTAQVGYANALVARTAFGKAPAFDRLFPNMKVETRKRTAEEYKAAMTQSMLIMNKKYK
jgi:hypothetical protein